MSIIIKAFQDFSDFVEGGKIFRIRIIRKLKHMNQTKLSIKSKLSVSRISVIENNFLDAKMWELLALAEALECHVIDLIDFKVLDKDTLLLLKNKIDEELE
ncbi:helix-turn-helix transcriptional regulator [uncultured Clostridium sp.]|uniref:helix-turn-helix domain-containing protein n=1 Tax=uncultured Clostridium sp. TaxID=59620 RepID=UPI00261BB6EE|nr:helix-turn-helix transcriptional regulator [uncultured Clostridium sp.]